MVHLRRHGGVSLALAVASLPEGRLLVMPLPVLTVIKPKVLDGITNGQLPPGALVRVTFADGKSGFLVAPAAEAATRLIVAARAELGIWLTATSNGDLYRSLGSQTALFTQRYSANPLPGRPTKTWQGRTYWQKPGVAEAASPGTSNHGWGLAVDFAEYDPLSARTVGLSRRTLDWLSIRGVEIGWSAELQSEPWHWRFVAGDRLTSVQPPKPPTPKGEDVVLLIQLDPVAFPNPQAHDPVMIANVVSQSWVRDPKAKETKLFALQWPLDTPSHFVSTREALMAWGEWLGPIPPGWTQGIDDFPVPPQ